MKEEEERNSAAMSAMPLSEILDTLEEIGRRGMRNKNRMFGPLLSQALPIET